MAVEWVENSLVDRPKDPDSKFTLMRADDAAKVLTCTVLEDNDSMAGLYSRAATADGMDDLRKQIETQGKEIERLAAMDDPKQKKPHMTGGKPESDPEDPAVKRVALKTELQELSDDDYSGKTEKEKQKAYHRVQEIRGLLGV